MHDRRKMNGGGKEIRLYYSKFGRTTSASLRIVTSKLLLKRRAEKFPCSYSAVKLSAYLQL
jgi:hypothetical protein